MISEEIQILESRIQKMREERPLDNITLNRLGVELSKMKKFGDKYIKYHEDEIKNYYYPILLAASKYLPDSYGWITSFRFNKKQVGFVKEWGISSFGSWMIPILIGLIVSTAIFAILAEIYIKMKYFPDDYILFLPYFIIMPISLILSIRIEYKRKKAEKTLRKVIYEDRMKYKDQRSDFEKIIQKTIESLPLKYQTRAKEIVDGSY